MLCSSTSQLRGRAESRVASRKVGSYRFCPWSPHRLWAYRAKKAFRLRAVCPTQEYARKVKVLRCSNLAFPRNEPVLLQNEPRNLIIGLAAAKLASPASPPDFLGADGLGSAPGVWRRLLRRQATSQRVPGSNKEDGPGGQEAEREARGNQRYVLCVDREISCGFSDAARGLLAASHGQAVQAVAAGTSEDGNAPGDEDLLVASTPAGGDESSSGVLRGESAGNCSCLRVLSEALDFPRRFLGLSRRHVGLRLDAHQLFPGVPKCTFPLDAVPSEKMFRSR